jgi:hypothetical protein
MDLTVASKRLDSRTTAAPVTRRLLLSHGRSSQLKHALSLAGKAGDWFAGRLLSAEREIVERLAAARRRSPSRSWRIGG